MSDIAQAQSWHILVVDDQSLSRTMVKAALKGAGFDNVTLAESATAAMEVIGRTKVDMVIADWRMPGATGLDLLKWVRGAEATKDLPFLMLTGERGRDAVIAAAAAGVTDYLGKPFSPDELTSKVKKILKQ